MESPINSKTEHAFIISPPSGGQVIIYRRLDVEFSTFGNSIEQCREEFEDNQGVSLWDGV